MSKFESDDFDDFKECRIFKDDGTVLVEFCANETAAKLIYQELSVLQTCLVQFDKDDRTKEWTVPFFMPSSFDDSHTNPDLDF